MRRNKKLKMLSNYMYNLSDSYLIIKMNNEELLKARKQSLNAARILHEEASRLMKEKENEQLLIEQTEFRALIISMIKCKSLQVRISSAEYSYLRDYIFDRQFRDKGIDSDIYNNFSYRFDKFIDIINEILREYSDEFITYSCMYSGESRDCATYGLQISWKFN